MSRLFPALDIHWPLRPDDERIEILIAEVDEEGPTAIEERPTGLRMYFPTSTARGRAAVRLVALEPDLTCEPIDVPDDDWAARSQASLDAVRIGRIIVAPPWTKNDLRGRFPDSGKTTPEVVFIQPSMGFGTGHHASTRLCLQLLQTLQVAGASVLDVGTGSGVLAIAAAKLGAARVLAIDNDPDALTSAAENVELNGVQAVVKLARVDVATRPPTEKLTTQGYDLVLANLTGTALRRHASALAGFLGPKGALIASGFEADEDDAVLRAFADAGVGAASRRHEDGWTAAHFSAASL